MESVTYAYAIHRLSNGVLSSPAQAGAGSLLLRAENRER